MVLSFKLIKEDTYSYAISFTQVVDKTAELSDQQTKYHSTKFFFKKIALTMYRHSFRVVFLITQKPQFICFQFQCVFCYTKSTHPHKCIQWNKSNPHVQWSLKHCLSLCCPVPNIRNTFELFIHPSISHRIFIHQLAHPLIYLQCWMSPTLQSMGKLFAVQSWLCIECMHCVICMLWCRISPSKPNKVIQLGLPRWDSGALILNSYGHT